MFSEGLREFYGKIRYDEKDRYSDDSKNVRRKRSRVATCFFRHATYVVTYVRNRTRDFRFYLTHKIERVKEMA